MSITNCKKQIEDTIIRNLLKKISVFKTAFPTSEGESPPSFYAFGYMEAGLYKIKTMVYI